MWALSVQQCSTSVFQTEEVRFVCECGSVISYRGHLQPTTCLSCARRLPDIQLLRNSSSMRAICHSDFNGFMNKKAENIEKSFDY